MTTQADDTPAEGQTLMQAPALAGMLGMLTGKRGPFQMVKEMWAEASNRRRKNGSGRPRNCAWYQHLSP
jgi:hypothetical protein